MPHLQPHEVLARYAPHDFTLPGLFASRMAAGPDRPFLLSEGRTWSWAEFDAAVGRCAALLHRRGIRQGDRVAVMATNHHAHVLLMLALARLGAILVPVNPEFGVAEARYVLEHAGAAAIFASAATWQVAEQASATMQPRPWFCHIDEAAPDGDADLPASAAAPDNTGIIIYSSGTTGFPKGVMHFQRTMVLCAERQVERVHLQPADRCMAVLPMFHVNALFYTVAGTMAAGCCLVVAPRFSASRFWDFVVETGTTQVNLLMAMTSILARRPRSEFRREHGLRCVSGSPFTRETMDAFLNEFGVARVIEGFGMSEAPGAFSMPYDGPHRLASMGKPGLHPDRGIRWTETRILDAERRDVPEGETGELALRVPTMMQGYWRDPDQTRAAFHDGWFLTGDLVYRDTEGFYFFVTRKKDIIRRRGENVAGAELDRVIGQHPAVAEAAAIPVPSDLGEDEILAVVVLRPGMAIEPQEIRDWCARSLAAHKWPRFVVFAERLPRTPTHKVAKFELRADAALQARATDLVPG